MIDPTFATVGVDGAAARRWITALGVVHDAPLTFERIGLGQSNLTIGVRDGSGRRWILRRPPLGTLMVSAHDIERESAILSALGSTDVPVPPVLGVCRDESVSSAPMVLMDHVDGLVLDDVSIAESVDTSVRRGVSFAMIDALVKIHAVDLDESGLTGLASHKPYAERQLRRWSAQWDMSRTRELPQLDELTSRLRESIPVQEKTVLVHGDFHLGNIICDPGSGGVRSVLDWELATLGDPLADLGTMLAYWPEPGEPRMPIFGASSVPGFASRAELVAAYVSRTGCDESSAAFWHALGLWKLAIIGEGVVRRTLDEPLNASAHGRPTTATVDQLVAQGLAAL